MSLSHKNYRRFLTAREGHAIMASTVPSTHLSPAKPLQKTTFPPLPAYFLLVFLGTWLLFLPLILDPTISEELFALLFILSTFSGPALAAIVVTRMTDGWQGVRQLLGRIFRWRVGMQWYAAALFGFMIVWFVGYSFAFNGAPFRELAAQPQTLLTIFLPFVLAVGLIPALGEEIGWRGYALPALERRFGPVAGTLILGLLHSLWHLPAFFSPVLGPFTPLGFLTFVITGTAGTFIYTWIFNNARHSILIAILIHAAGNAASVLLGTLLAEQSPANATFEALIASGWFNALLFSVVALILVMVTRGRLSYRGEENGR
jgi:uncharacterized protein